MKCIDGPFRPGIKCKPMEEMNTYIDKNLIRVKIGYIDCDFDVTNYKETSINYINDIKNDLRGEDFTVNNLNFFPALVQTDSGLIFEDYSNIISYRLNFKKN